MRKLLVLLSVLPLIAFLVPNVSAITISATATGSSSPIKGETPLGGGTTSIVNGDFTITQTSPAGYNYKEVGDALNETTTWIFDFTGDSNFSSFSSAAPITSAWFTIEYYYGIQAENDYVQLQGGSAVSIPEISGGNDTTQLNYPNTVFHHVEFDLLNYYNNLLEIFNDNNGYIPMQYDDDALVTYAKLDLVSSASPVPEPATLFLLGTGLMGLACIARRRLRK